MSNPASESNSKVTIERMRSDLASVLGISVSEIADGDFLPDLGLDSIRAMMLVERWTKDGAKVDFAALAEKATLGEWAVMLCE